MRTFDASEIERLLGWDAAYASQELAFRNLADGIADQPARLILPSQAEGEATGFCYAARLGPGHGMVCKFGGVAEHNPAAGLPAVHALVAALDAHTGAPTALLDGEALTVRRTAAASLLAARHLAPKAARLGIIGAGVQARGHLEALRSRYDFRWVVGWSRRPQRCAELGEGVLVAPSAEDVAKNCDLIILATTSKEPVLRGSWITAGTTVISVGSFSADRCEVDDELVDRANLLVVDHPPIALEHAGPLVRAVADGRRRPANLVALGDVVAGRHPGRSHTDQIVYYNSVGVGVQDAAAAWAVIEAAR